MKQKFKRLFSSGLVAVLIFIVAMIMSTNVKAASKPAQVKKVATYSVSPTSFYTKWAGVSKAKGYQVNVYLGSKLKKSYTTTSKKVKVSGLLALNKYTVKVRAYTLSGKKKVYGSYSKNVYRTTLKPATVSKPILKVLSNTSIKATWKKLSGIGGYQVLVYNGKTLKKSTYTKKTSINITGLTSSTPYTVRIRAYINVNKVTKYGNKSTAVTKTTSAPLKPVITKTKALSSTQVQIAWKKLYGIKGYEIVQYYNKKWIPVYRTTKTVYSAGGFKAGQTVYLRVRGFVIVNGKYKYGSPTMTTIILEAGQTPTTQPMTQEPTTQITTTQKPTTQKPTTQEPTPTTQEPTTQEPTTQEPTTQEPTTQEPTTQKPTTQSSTTQEPTPTTQEPTTQEPTTQEPTTQEPTTQKPTTQEPVEGMITITLDANGKQFFLYDELDYVETITRKVKYSEVGDLMKSIMVSPGFLGWSTERISGGTPYLNTTDNSYYQFKTDIVLFARYFTTNEAMLFKDLLPELNRLRAQYELAPAVWGSALDEGTLIRAKELAIRDDHIRPDGSNNYTAWCPYNIISGSTAFVGNNISRVISVLCGDAAHKGTLLTDSRAVYVCFGVYNGFVEYAVCTAPEYQQLLDYQAGIIK